LNFHWYPIHYAVGSQDSKIIELLLSFDHNDEELERLSENDYSSCLHLAVSGGQLEIVLLLLRHGINVNLRNIEGNTSLHLSMVFSEDIICRSLLAYHSNLHIKNNEGKTASELAVIFHNQDISDLMKAYEHGAESIPDINEIELEVVQQDSSKILKRRQQHVIRSGTNINPVKVEELEHRLQDIESKVEQVMDTMKKIRSIGNKSNICCSCLSPVAKECSLCHLFYCETCMKKEKRHKCLSK